MKTRIRKYGEQSPIEWLLLRQKLGMGKYIKRRKRDPEKRELLIQLGLEKIREQEMYNFLPLGFRRRKLIVRRRV